MKDVLNLKYGLGKNTVVPYVIARSGIFSSQIYRGPCERPEAANPLQIATLCNSVIAQTAGQRLDQSDAEVFYEIVRVYFTEVKNDSIALQVEIERSNLLSGIGRTKGGKTNKLLHDSLIRLVGSEFFIREADRYRTIGILKGFSYQSKGDCQSIQIEIDPGLVELYLGNQWTVLRKTERTQLSSPIAQALYAYYRTHKEPRPLKTATIKTLVGREEMRETKWLTQLRYALDEIKRATGWPICEIATSGKYMGKVVVTKKAAEQGPQHKVFLKPENSTIEIEDDYGI